MKPDTIQAKPKSRSINRSRKENSQDLYESKISPFLRPEQRSRLLFTSGKQST